METKHHIGVIGMATMGRGVARNLASKGFDTAIQSRSYESALSFYENLEGPEKGNLTIYRELSDFVNSLSRPRKIALLVQAGKPTDEVIEKLTPLLSSGDIIMDMGNSFYLDTEKRAEILKASGIHFMGVGISGGEKGALYGPSIMAGGSVEGWDIVSPALIALSADHPQSGKCCGYFGQGGAGHFVKMVHNGIEYAYMEILSELYLVMRKVYGLSAEEAGNVFVRFEKDKKVSSYLVEITAKILFKTDDISGKPLIEFISDRAGNKGTGKWTAESALDLGVATSTLVEALLARYLSSEREKPINKGLDEGCAEDGNLPVFGEKEYEMIKGALEFSQYCCFDQGIRLIRKAVKLKGWELNFPEILRVWENGCIIRTAFSWRMKDALEREADLPSFWRDSVIGDILRNNVKNASDIVTKSMAHGVPVFCLASAVNDYHGLTTDLMPTALIQAQRDFFGAHTYERIDRDGVFHTEWE